MRDDPDYENELAAKELLHSLGGPLPPGEAARSAQRATVAFFKNKQNDPPIDPSKK